MTGCVLRTINHREGQGLGLGPQAGQSASTEEWLYKGKCCWMEGLELVASLLPPDHIARLLDLLTQVLLTAALELPVQVLLHL